MTYIVENNLKIPFNKNWHVDMFNISEYAEIL